MSDRKMTTREVNQRHQAYQAQLHERANAGDTAAKREIEVENLRRSANANAEKLRDKASSGDTAAMESLRLLAKGGEPAASPQAPAAQTGFSQAHVNNAVADGVKGERDRVATVFASEHSRGRERGCVALLTADKNWSAAEIVANLADLPTDKEGRANGPEDRQKADDVWNRANSAIGRVSETDAEDDAPRETASDPWERAYNSVGRTK